MFDIVERSGGILVAGQQMSVVVSICFFMVLIYCCPLLDDVKYSLAFEK